MEKNLPRWLIGISRRNWAPRNWQMNKTHWMWSKCVKEHRQHHRHQCFVWCFSIFCFLFVSSRFGPRESRQRQRAATNVQWRNAHMQQLRVKVMEKTRSCMREEGPDRDRQSPWPPSAPYTWDQLLCLCLLLLSTMKYISDTCILLAHMCSLSRHRHRPYLLHHTGNAAEDKGEDDEERSRMAGVWARSGGQSTVRGLRSASAQCDNKLELMETLSMYRPHVNHERSAMPCSGYRSTGIAERHTIMCCAVIKIGIEWFKIDNVSCVRSRACIFSY